MIHWILFLVYYFIGFYFDPSFIMARKLKALKVDLKKWNEEVFGHVEKQKRVLLDEL